MRFVEKKVLKKTETKQKGNTLLPTYSNGGFLYFFFLKSKYKVFISKPVADKKKKQERKKYNLSGGADSGLICWQKKEKKNNFI